ncbi:MAG: hypothetical protein QNK19_15220 [Xanthomonadales bacterium]|nr:hypothetical protein [Xanthomonadales bacterium]
MPLRKRIHTTASDRFPVHNTKKSSQIRRIIAAEAARIMSTQSLFNYRVAKQKAVERLGFSLRTTMPSNAEVERALRAYQGVYGGQRHIRRLQKMRRVALRVMHSLESFCPRLVGPVLEGTADENARVSIHVFSDPPDAVVIHLLDRGLVFRNEQRKIRWHDGNFKQVQLLVTNAQGIEVELTLFNCMDLRQAPLSPVDGRPQKRAPLSEVECLLTDT